ncbi:RDD family protein [Streptomyces sp. ACA25]|uniref:RDD family protein n=1 Tax=Streptomyces sp. ACA25 TaxID=3022596 RepID=UPI002307E21E|nr:RDD family protein [Streptomyces sp. ACA25]MDB1087150.1 RDD family protein [Streptomyces sp. ACA25]
MSHLVTGDAVVLGIQPAKLPSRALAIAMDLVVYVGGYLLLSLTMLGAVLDLGSATAAAVQVALFLLLLVGVPVAVETLSQGRSLGKLACGLRVVRDDGGPIRFRHALVRWLIGLVEILMTFGFLACVASLVSERGRRLGDVFAGALVVRERLPTGTSTPLPPPPPQLAGRFAALDLSRVPDGLWLAVRQYLTRAGQLDQQVSWSMAVRLADDMVEHTGAPAPAGIHPAAYLSLVVGERQRRDAERTFGSPANGPAPGWYPGQPAPPGFPARPDTGTPHAQQPPPPPSSPPPHRPAPAGPDSTETSGAEKPHDGGFTPPS